LVGLLPIHQRGRVAIGLLSFSTFPLFTAAVEPIALGTRPTRTQILASVVILAGVYILVPSFSLQSTTLQGVLWGLAAAFTFAVLSVFNRKLGKSHASPVISFYQFVVATIILLPTLIWNHPATLTEPRTIALLILLGTACTALAHTAFISGMRHISTMLASLFASLEPVWGIAFALVFLSEVPTLRSMIGGVVIVGASAVAGLRG
jgi:drug/metabolite transporter (DMT)-like permease